MTDVRPITISEEKIRQLFAEFKLDLFDMLAKKVDEAEHKLLEHRVTQLELWQAGQVATERVARQITGRQLAVVAIVVAFGVGVMTAAASLLSNLF